MTSPISDGSGSGVGNRTSSFNRYSRPISDYMGSSSPVSKWMSMLSSSYENPAGMTVTEVGKEGSTCPSHPSRPLQSD